MSSRIDWPAVWRRVKRQWGGAMWVLPKRYIHNAVEAQLKAKPKEKASKAIWYIASEHKPRRKR